MQQQQQQYAAMPNDALTGNLCRDVFIMLASVVSYLCRMLLVLTTSMHRYCSLVQRYAVLFDDVFI